MVRRTSERATDVGVPIELGLRETLSELLYLLRRARHVWVRVLVISVVLTGLLVARMMSKPLVFESRVVLRVTEGEGEIGTRPKPARKLQNHVYEVIFNKQRLRDLADRFHLEQSAFKRSAEAGLENVRDSIEIEVWQNYFLEQSDVSERSARIAVTFAANDPQLALECARALATMYIQAEQQARLSISEEALGANEQLIDEAREDLEIAERRVAEARGALTRRADAARAMLDLSSWEAQRTAMADQLRVLEQRRTDLQVQLGYERNQLGLHIEVVDNGSAQVPTMTKPMRVLLRGSMMFVVLVLAFSILLAAFDDHLRDRRDLRLIGMPLLGVVPSPPDPQSLSLAQRIKRAAGGKS